MVKKRFFIGFNGILFALFLDLCLLISIRTVDHHGHFQSVMDKWETLLYVIGIYVSFLLFEMILLLIMRHRKNKHILGQVLQRLVLFMSDYGDIYVTIFFATGGSIIKASPVKLTTKGQKNKRVAVSFGL